MELVDTTDLKSVGCISRAGSSPAPGTEEKRLLIEPFFISAGNCSVTLCAKFVKHCLLWCGYILRWSAYLPYAAFRLYRVHSVSWQLILLSLQLQFQLLLHCSHRVFLFTDLMICKKWDTNCRVIFVQVFSFFQRFDGVYWNHFGSTIISYQTIVRLRWARHGAKPLRENYLLRIMLCTIGLLFLPSL